MAVYHPDLEDGVLSIYRFSDLIQLLIWGIRRLDEDLKLSQLLSLSICNINLI